MIREAPCVGVVEDDAEVRVALGRLLRIAGYEVATFESGVELLAARGARMPDCLVVDVHLPGMSGFEMQARLRAEGFDPPTVFISGGEDPGLAERVREVGGVRLLHKPFSNAALIEAVVTALARARAS
jgi:FixJ family two-component response regulator